MADVSNATLTVGTGPDGSGGASAEGSLPGVDVLSKLGHELRGPLNGITGLTGIMLMKLAAGSAEPAQQIRQLEMIRTSAGELLATVERIVDVARLDTAGSPTTPGPVDCTEVVEDVIAPMRPGASAAGVGLLVETPGHAVSVAVDRGTLDRLLTELVDNAVKYTDSTQVRVRVDAVPDGAARIDISDDGPGIEEDEQERIFAPFARGTAAHDRAVSGSGLGLYLASKLASRIGCRLSLRSAPGLGSTFSVHLAGSGPCASG